MDYKEFLKLKEKQQKPKGLKYINPNPNAFDFQKYITEQALAHSRFGVFADCGLGKTLMQLDWAYNVVRQTNKRVLDLTPLAVSGQTKQEAVKFDIDLDKIDITNYEKLKNLDCSDYGGIVLDESSILKNFEGKFRNLIIELFYKTPHKLCCTATPSPNDIMELGNHAEFLNQMSRNEMLAMYFIHDGGDTAKWRLKGHGRTPFYKWMSTWSMILNKPSDLGFSDDNYQLPKLNFHKRIVHTPAQEGMLFNTVKVSATGFNQELRNTQEQRIEECLSVLSNLKGQVIIWVKHNEESKKLKALIPDSEEVQGGEKDEAKASKLLGFAKNEFRVLITKPKIAQFGLNYQNCHNQIFLSPDFSFESLYQSVRRSYRFGQKHDVNIFIIITDTMFNVIESIEQKEKSFQTMKTEIVNQWKQKNTDLYRATA